MNPFHVNIWIESEATQHVGVFIERVVTSSQAYTIDPSRVPSWHLQLPSGFLRHRRRTKSSCPRAPASVSSAATGGDRRLGESFANRSRAVSISGDPSSPSSRSLPLRLQLLRRSRERSCLTLHAIVDALASRVARLSGFRLRSPCAFGVLLICLFRSLTFRSFPTAWMKYAAGRGRICRAVLIT